MDPLHSSSSEIWQKFRHNFNGVYDRFLIIAKTKRKSIKLTIMLMRLMGLWHSSSKSEKLRSHFVVTVALILMIYSVYVQAQELYFCRHSITLITFAAPPATIVFTETSKLIVFIVKWKQVKKLNKFVDNDFWKRTYTEEEEKIFNKCDDFCFKYICLNLSTMLYTCTHYVLLPLLGTGGSTKKREFPFPMRYSTSLYESPFFEMYFSLEIVATLVVGLCVSTFTSYLIAINMFTAAQFQILNLNISSICDFNGRFDAQTNLKFQREALQKLKRYINRHQVLINLTKDIDDLYCYVMLEQVFGTVAQTCFCGVQILSVKTTLQRTTLGIEFLIDSSLQFLTFCYSSNAVLHQSQNVLRAVYFTKWYQITDLNIRKEFTQLMRIITIRASRACNLSVGKLYPMTLSTFVSVMRTSLSYFTVLRQLIR